MHGVIFLRPGDLPADQVIAMLEEIDELEIDWTPPLLAVYGRGKLRLRAL